ncbi:MAG: hypothetical protein ACF8GE_02370 [Phycisphaerales bacterium JB043]
MIFTWDPVGDSPTTHRVRCDRVRPDLAARQFVDSGAEGLLLQNLELLRSVGGRGLFEHRWSPQSFASYVSGRVMRHEALAGWVSRCADALERLGGRIERLVLDIEWGVGPWHIEWKDRIEACRGALRAAPGHALADAWRRLSRSPRDRESLQAWITWASEHRAGLIRRLIVDPLVERVGEFAWSNYNDVGVCDRPVLDRNGWDTRGNTFGAEASPVLYMVDLGGSRYRGHDDRRWATMVDHIDRVRAIVSSGRRVVPWLTLPHQVGVSGGERDFALEGLYLWQEMVHHCAMMGVRDWLVWWNPSRTTDMEYGIQAAHRFIEYAESFAEEHGTIDARTLDSLSLDVGVVRTGPVETSRDRLLGF